MPSVTTLRSALHGDECALLERALAGDDDASSGRVLDVPVDDLTADDLNDLRESVGLLLVREGFEADRSANELGRRCEDLIDRLAPWHWDKDA